MTSDAKVGLLLGLVFIVAIAFLLNGLPGLIGNGSSDRRIDQTVSNYGDGYEDYDINENADKAINFMRYPNGKGLPSRNSSNDKNDDRYDNPNVPKNGGNGRPDNKRVISNKKFYTVQEGDNLGRIAVKTYGKEIGNKQATIDLIFEMNRKILSSADDIFIGDKLVMPLLDSKGNLVKKKTAKVRKPKKASEEDLLDSGLFERVGTSIKNVFSSNKKPSPLYTVYTVKDHDNLWKIAHKKLGNGSRSSEIKKINKGILRGSDDVAPGMKLKIPQK